MLLLTGVMGTDGIAQPRAPEVIRARAQLAKQKYEAQRSRQQVRPSPDQRFYGKAAAPVDSYRKIPKRIRRQLEPRVQRILKYLSRTGQRGPATFDGDGTLWGGDVGEGFFRWMLGKRHYPAERIPMLRRAWTGYRTGTLPGEKMYELMVTSMAGMQESEVKQLAERYFDTVHRHRIYRPSSNLIQALSRMGIEPWVISGSPRWVVAAGARHIGIPAHHVIGLGVKVDRQGRLTGEVVRPVPWQHGKAKRIIRDVGQTPLLAAGNSYGDIQMLKTASELSLVINPGPRVLHHARTLGWTIHRYTRRDEFARSIRLLPPPSSPQSAPDQPPP